MVHIQDACFRAALRHGQCTSLPSGSLPAKRNMCYHVNMMVGNVYLAWGHMLFSFIPGAQGGGEPPCIPGAFHAANQTQVLNKCNCSEALSRLFSNKYIFFVNLVTKAVSYLFSYVYECRHV